MREALADIRVLIDEPLSNYTYTKTGGNADILAFPKSVAEVKVIVDACLEEQVPWIVLGNASNLIIRDGGIRGVVIILSDMNKTIIENDVIVAQAGAKLVEVSRMSAEEGLTGLEFACGIPGSIGGAIYMNAGAYDGQMSDVFVSCEVLLTNGEIKTIEASDMQFSYRHSVIQEIGCIVLSVELKCDYGDAEAIMDRVSELTSLREEKQPLEYPSCGSVFKRPEGYFTGKLIQDAGLQGFTHGGAQVSMKHAGFIVNIDNATATDYIELIEHIKHVIYDKYQVELETEVRIIGEDA